jgi:hypothetical protein
MKMTLCGPTFLIVVVGGFGVAAAGCGSSGSSSPGPTTPPLDGSITEPDATVPEASTDDGSTDSGSKGDGSGGGTTDGGSSDGSSSDGEAASDGGDDGSLRSNGDSGSDAAGACSPACDAGLQCITGSCVACGTAATACCPSAAAPDAQSACNAPLECAGAACTCVVGCSGIRVQRSDGSLWDEGTDPVMTASSALFLATNFSAGGVSLQCGVQSGGSAWCWGSNGIGQLGNNGANAGSSPAQVVTASGPLANVAKIFVDGEDGEVACAVDTGSDAWCWGYGGLGALGTGNTSSSSVAVPVLTQSGGPQLSGVDQMAVAHDHVCATKTDGTLWCWGLNASGQVGVGSAQTPILYPAQVSSLAHVTSISVALSISCATTPDGAVWCWGTNASGQLGNGLTSGQSTSPVQVLSSADAGVPFGGAAQVNVGSGTVCALKTADRSLWCWGANTDSQSKIPVPFTEQSLPVSGVFVLCNNTQDLNRPSFIDGTGVVHENGAAEAVQVTCP